jgi:hypothetical protein
MKKQCDNCSKELSKSSFFNPAKKVYRYNTVMLCQTCFEDIISHRDQQLKKNNPGKTELLFIDRFSF